MKEKTDRHKREMQKQRDKGRTDRQAEAGIKMMAEDFRSHKSHEREGVYMNKRERQTKTEKQADGVRQILTGIRQTE